MSNPDLSWIILSKKSGVPLFDQVRLHILEGARSGRLPVGTKLPPVRKLATTLGLAANTVARAYRALEKSGVVATHGRGGTIVTAEGDEIRGMMGDAAEQYARVAHSLGYSEAKAISVFKAAMGRVRREDSL